MTPPYRPSNALAGLLNRLVEGRLDEQEAVSLEILLQESPAARAYYRLFLAVHLGLQEVFQADSGVIPLPAARRRRAVWPWLGLAAALVATAGLVTWAPLHRPPPPAAADTNTRPPATASGPVLAVMASAREVLWNLPATAEAGLRLSAGPVRLTKGEMVLTLANGQTLAVRAPADFELINDREIALHSGAVSLLHDVNHGLLVVRLGKGAVVSSAGEFSISARPDGGAALRVFGGEVSASTVDQKGHSREEALATPGATLEIGDRLQTGQSGPDSFYRIPHPLPTAESIADATYATAVLADSPVAYWRFEEATADHLLPSLVGENPLELRGNAVLAGPPGRRFLAVDDRQRRGFAYGREVAIALAPAGFTIECVFYSASETYGTALVLESATVPAPTTGLLRHAPNLCAIERMGRRGENIGHIHPDYALRAVARFPAGFEEGTNLYSDQSHLLHAWHHTALTFDGTTLRLYLDGRLSDQAPASFVWGSDRVRPVIGRLQPNPRDEARQWIGGIDEVAIYPRPLDPATLSRHHRALRKR